MAANVPAWSFGNQKRGSQANLASGVPGPGQYSGQASVFKQK